MIAYYKRASGFANECLGVMSRGAKHRALLLIMFRELRARKKLFLLPSYRRGMPLHDSVCHDPAVLFKLELGICQDYGDRFTSGRGYLPRFLLHSSVTAV